MAGPVVEAQKGHELLRCYLHECDAFLAFVIQEKSLNQMLILVGGFLVLGGELEVEILEWNREERNNTLRSQKGYGLVVNPQKAVLHIDARQDAIHDSGFYCKSNSCYFERGCMLQIMSSKFFSKVP
jgi:hypothetical protein